MIRGQAGTILVFAFNATTGDPVDGDAVNITCKISKDGGSPAPIGDTTPTVMEDGKYLFTLTATETDAATVDPYPESSTSGVRVIPLHHIRDTISQAGTSGALVNLPPYPLAAYMTGEVYTYADIVYRLLARRGLNGSTRDMYILKIAVKDAFTELCNRGNWRHFNRRVAFSTEATQNFTSATFDASDNTLTIASGSWPTNAALGEIVYGEKRYKVRSRNSNTELLLSSVTGPSANFTGTVTWMRCSYALPYLIKQIKSVMDELNYRELEYMSPVEMIRHRRMARTTAQAMRYTVRASENYNGLAEIEISPVPSTATRIEIGMIVRPRPFSIFEVTGTDGAYSSGGTTFTSASSTFTSEHVGCVLRVSATSTVPKGKTQFDDNKPEYSIQVMIEEVLSATSVRVSTAFSAAGSSKGFTVSDIVDINAHTMLAPLEAIAWEKYCHNHEQATEMYPAALRMAQLEFDRGIAADLASEDSESPVNSPWNDYGDYEPNVSVLGD